MSIKSGIPVVWPATISSAAFVKHLFPALTQHVMITSDNPLDVAFSQADADAGVFVPVTATAPLSLPLSLRGVWLKAVSTSCAVKVLSTHFGGGRPA